jgi:FAD/FMN-containing dehydrogenase/Fe-S oxidoreductase
MHVCMGRNKLSGKMKKSSAGLIELEQAIKGAIRGEIHFDALTRQLYSTDASNYRVVPLGVVIPRDEDDITAVLEVAGRFNAPVVPRGAGTSLSGQSIGPAIILDTSRYIDSILDFNAEEGWVQVQPGVVLDHLNRYLLPKGLMFGPDPSSCAAATLGGMLGNNSTGTHSIVYGMTADHTIELEIALADGTRLTVGNSAPLPTKYRTSLDSIIEQNRSQIEKFYPKTWRTVAGYALNDLSQPNANPARLFVGSEGTLGIILTAKLHVVNRPKYSRVAILQFDALRVALESVPVILETDPAAVELLDYFFIQLTRSVPNFSRRLSFVDGCPRCLLIVEYFGANDAELSAKINRLTRKMQSAGYSGEIRVQTSSAEIANVWTVRKAGFGLLMSLRGDAKPLAFIDDAVVPVEHLADYAEGVTRICADSGTEAAFYAHASAGCLHINPLLNLKTEQGLFQMRTIAQKVVTLAISLGGTTTGEHGEGLARSCYNEQLFGSRLHQAFREVKSLFDPRGLLNPGKIVDGLNLDDPGILRFNPQYRTPFAPERTQLDFSTDGGFAGLVEMCNGQGVCRQRGNGTMCPSFIATRDERHSVRGRANALRAAISGQLGEKGLNNSDLYDILDLCLSCKACRSECPSTVDMAKLKYEFLAQYQSENGVSIRSRLFGHLADLYKVASHFPGISNLLLSNKMVKQLMDVTLGIDRRRTLPEITPITFQTWFKNRPNRFISARKVVLWDDCYLSYNEPEIGKAAVKVLEAAGFSVILPFGRRCCGRPLITKGFLGEAKKNADHNIRILAEFADACIPIIGLEPSCITTFKDEYPDLATNRDQAELVAKNSFLFEEFLMGIHNQGQLNLQFAYTDQKHILLHGHCYEKANTATNHLVELMELVPGMIVEEIPSGCCGMAGSFGYEVEHYDLSLTIGEDRLFPAVRAAEPDTIIAAAGMSCRHQIFDGTGKLAVHPIIIIQQSLTDITPEEKI